MTKRGRNLKVKAKNYEATIKSVKAVSDMQNRIDKALLALNFDKTKTATLNVFGEEFNGTESNKSAYTEIILNNIKEKNKEEIVFNLLWLTFDFNNQIITVEYYCKDPDYPAVNISFEDLKKFLSII